MILEIRYAEWRQFKCDLLYDLFGSNTYLRNCFLFRGQRDSDWVLESSFDRWYKGLRTSVDRIELADKILELFRKECERANLDSQILGDDIRVLALGQHHGLPTRLLDWSESPYVASFFALSDLISNSSLDGMVAIWALDSRSKVWNEERGVEIVDVPPFSNLRLRNQSGKFTLSRTPFSCLEEYVDHVAPKEKTLTKIMLPATETRIALAELDAMGINHSQVYPEIGGAALAAKMRALLES